MYKDENHYTLYKRGKIFGYYYYDEDNKRHFRSTGRKTKYEAQKVINERIQNGDLRYKKMLNGITFEEYAKIFFIADTCPIIKDAARRGKPLAAGTIYNYQKAMKNHVIPYFKTKLLKNITAKNIREFEDHEIEEGFSPSSINRATTAIKMIMAQAVSDEIIKKNPCDGHKQLNEKKSTREAWTVEQIKMIISSDQWTDEYCRYAFKWACMTGMRIGELQALRVKNVSDGCITVSEAYNHNTNIFGDTKNHTTRYIPLPEILKEDYTTLASGKKNEDLLFSKTGIYPFSHSVMSQNIIAIKASLCIDSSNLTFHSCRHFFDTYMAGETDIKKEKIMEVMGHKSDKMYHHYMHLSQDHLKDLKDAQTELSTKLTT